MATPPPEPRRRYESYGGPMSKCAMVVRSLSARLKWREGWEARVRMCVWRRGYGCYSPYIEARRWQLGSGLRTRRCVVQRIATEQLPAQLGDLRRLCNDRLVEKIIRSLERCDHLLLRGTIC